MWNSQETLNLLSSMQNPLSEENLKQLQDALDLDRNFNSVKLGENVCGDFAPFCEKCNKEEKYPCAIAYINMKREEGMDIEISEPKIIPDQLTAETGVNKIRIATLKKKKN